MTSTLEASLKHAGYDYNQLLEESEHIYKGEHAFLRSVTLEDGTTTIGICYRPGGTSLYGLPYFAEERRLSKFKRAFRGRGKGKIFKNGNTYRFSANSKNTRIPEEPPLVVTDKLEKLKRFENELLLECISRYRAGECDELSEADIRIFLKAMDGDVFSTDLNGEFKKCMSWYLDVSDGGVIEHDEFSLSITPISKMNALEIVAEYMMEHGASIHYDRSYPVQEYLFYSHVI